MDKGSRTTMIILDFFYTVKMNVKVYPKKCAFSGSCNTNISKCSFVFHYHLVRYCKMYFIQNRQNDYKVKFKFPVSHAVSHPTKTHIYIYIHVTSFILDAAQLLSAVENTEEMK